MKFKLKAIKSSIPPSRTSSSYNYFIQDREIDKAHFTEKNHYEHLNQIIVTRYLRLSFVKHIFNRKLERTRLVYFFDDDIFDFRVIKKLPLRYFLKIFLNAFIYKKILTKIFDEIWVSSTYLQNKYKYLNSILITPHQVTDPSQNINKLIICYHGSASHRKEIEWLLPIIGEVQKRVDYIHFEIFGNASVNRAFRTIPRVSVLHPMSWENYLAYTFSHKADIGLAPLLDCDFNLGRSPTKFFDYARMGAVGIYSDHDVYKHLVVNNINGVLVENNSQYWIEKIIELSSNLEKLNSLKREVKNFSR